MVNDATLWSAIAGAILSALFRYFPSLRKKFDTLDGDVKRAWMIVLMAAVSLVLSFNQYYGEASCPSGATVQQCSFDLLIGFFKSWGARFIAAMVANQAAFLVLPGGSATDPKGTVTISTATKGTYATNTK